jgi:hypothetical protein
MAGQATTIWRIDPVEESFGKHTVSEMIEEARMRELKFEVLVVKVCFNWFIHYLYHFQMVSDSSITFHFSFGRWNWI